MPRASLGIDNNNNRNNRYNNNSSLTEYGQYICIYLTVECVCAVVCVWVCLCDCVIVYIKLAQI